MSIQADNTEDISVPHSDPDEEYDVHETVCPRCGCGSYSSLICTVCGYDFAWIEEDDNNDEPGE